MNWKTKKDTFLIQKNMARIPFFSGGVGLPNGERFNESAEYYEITGNGDIIKKYGAPTPFSYDGEMTVSSIHLVIGDSLYEFIWSHQYPYEASQQVKLILYGLQLNESPLPVVWDSIIQAYERDKG